MDGTGGAAAEVDPWFLHACAHVQTHTDMNAPTKGGSQVRPDCLTTVGRFYS